MEEHEWLAQRFDAHRTHLRAVAYRMLGSISEADDAVQQTWLRLSRSDTSGIENLGGWLTTVVGWVCLDMLRSRRSTREGLLGVHVPEPIVSRADGIDPEHEALLIDSVSLALLVVLETLSPAERLASSRRSTETTARRWCPTRGPVSPPRLASAWSSAKAPPGRSSPATLPASPSADGRGGRARSTPPWRQRLI
jgi:DNA-directed RNA polymerase specialized sigma24 family protein